GTVLEDHVGVAEHGVDAGRLVLLLGGVTGRIGLFPQLGNRDVLLRQFLGRGLGFRRRAMGTGGREGGQQQQRDEGGQARPLHAAKSTSGRPCPREVTGGLRRDGKGRAGTPRDGR